jgi:3-oxoacid CoA-transferase subunit A
MNKVIPDPQQAIADIQDGATIMFGGFGLCGIPENLIQALCDKGVRNLTVISNNAGTEDFGVGLLLRNQQAKKMIASYVGENRTFEELVRNGKLQIELSPQGTLAERIRAGGAGIGGFYTPTGYGTIAAENKETRTWHERHYVLELPLRAQFSLVKAWRGDALGNLVLGLRRKFQSGHGHGGRCDDCRSGGTGRDRQFESRPRSHAGNLRSEDSSGIAL